MVKDGETGPMCEYRMLKCRQETYRGEEEDGITRPHIHSCLSPSEPREQPLVSFSLLSANMSKYVCVRLFERERTYVSFPSLL